MPGVIAVLLASSGSYFIIFLLLINLCYAFFDIATSLKRHVINVIAAKALMEGSNDCPSTSTPTCTSRLYSRKLVQKKIEVIVIVKNAKRVYIYIGRSYYLMQPEDTLFDALIDNYSCTNMTSKSVSEPSTKSFRRLFVVCGNQKQQPGGNWISPTLLLPKNT